ncbi:potassium transporter Kup [Dongia sp.]|uniref:potassium transporter Kup n=1 Tax=Dongia sp. TaxID=1977262 RepID=UPI003750D21E
MTHQSDPESGLPRPQPTAHSGETGAPSPTAIKLAIGALGVVYGDIGTSPLYTLRECFSPAHGLGVDRVSVYGVLSLIFWAVMIIVSGKYALLILRADNQGQGGMLALIALALQRARNMGRRKLLFVLGMIGAALFIGDGMITPAISVLSAVEGLAVAEPGLEHYVVPITLVIVVGLFLVQSRGTGMVGGLFGPVVCLWFIALAVLGIHGIVGNPEVLLAINPYYGVRFLFEHAVIAFPVLGSVLLAITGAEALYTDLGHFGRRPIQTSWFSLVLPALMLNYFGQGALILEDPSAVKNPFYLLVPEWGLYPMIVLATCATIIASQAVITGAFSLIWQAMRLGMSPRFWVEHTSEHQVGQIYVPQMNWILMVSVCMLILGFRSSANLASAYGIAVTGAMMIDSIVGFMVVQSHWNWSRTKAGLIFGGILTVELSFFVASLLKIGSGGWFPLVIGAAIFFVFSTWMAGRALLARRQGQSALTEDEFLAALSERHLSRVPGTGMFLTGDPQRVPFSLLHNMRHNQILHQRVILTSVLTEEVPVVPDIEKVTVKDLGRGFYRLICRFGFYETPDIAVALRGAKRFGLELEPQQISFFLGRERIVAHARSQMSAWRRWLFILLSHNETSASDYFRLPAGRIIELGARVEI